MPSHKKKSSKKKSKPPSQSTETGAGSGAGASSRTTNTSSTNKKLNPFYIEQPDSYQQQQQTWDGDYDWNRSANNEIYSVDDDMDEEHAGLLMGDGGDDRFYEDPSDDPTFHHRNHAGQRRRQRRRRRLLDATTSRVLVCAGFLTIVFWVLLSATNRSDNHNGGGGDSPSSPSSSSTTNHQGEEEDDDRVDILDDDAKIISEDDSDDKPAYIVVLGERHTGAEWVVEQLKECYHDHLNDDGDVRLSFGYTRPRPGYWFQYINDSGIEDLPSKDYNVVVVATVRDPYDWVQQMWQQPLFAPAHWNATTNAPLDDLTQFLTQPWTVVGDDNDTDGKNDSCQLDFRPNQVVPCWPNGTTAANYNLTDTDTPVYELHPETGGVVDNVVALRALKLRSLYELGKENNNDPVLVPYETGLTEDVLKQLMERTHVDALGCGSATAPDDDNKSTTNMTLPEVFWKWMEENVEWEIEARVGYSRRNATTTTTSATGDNEP